MYTINSTYKVFSRYVLYVVLLAGLFCSSCDVTEDYYGDLQDTLQLAGTSYTYQSTYMVGDTISFHGRFGNSLESDLKIQIGDVEAELVNRAFVNEPESERENMSYDSKLQLVQVPVTEQMGVGPDRPVVFTLEDQLVNGPPIYIRDEGTPAVFTNPLELQPTDFNFDNQTHYFIESENGSGRVFFFNYENSTLNVWENGKATELPIVFTDEIDDFTFVRINGANVDKSETQLVLSASTENTNTGETLRRLCKIDLTTNQLTTLNTTITTSVSEGPWEGPVGEVKLPAMYKMWVGQNGTVYFNTGQIARFDLTYALTGKITPKGEMVYIAGRGIFDGIPMNLPAIEFSNPGGGSTSSPRLKSFKISPDNGLLYHLAYVQRFAPFERYIMNVYDLEEQREVGSFVPENAENTVDNVFDAPFAAAKFDMGGTWFLWDDKPVFFLTGNNSANSQTAAVVIDFENEETYAYAPSFHYDVGFIFDRTVLNYTPDGNVIFMRQYKNFVEELHPLYTLEVTEEYEEEE